MQPIITISNIVINIKISRYQGSLIVLDRKASRWVHPDCVCIAYVESKEIITYVKIDNVLTEISAVVLQTSKRRRT